MDYGSSSSSCAAGATVLITSAAETACCCLIQGLPRNVQVDFLRSDMRHDAQGWTALCLLVCHAVLKQQ
jgi:hypothetical protein